MLPGRIPRLHPHLHTHQRVIGISRTARWIEFVSNNVARNPAYFGLALSITEQVNIKDAFERAVALVVSVVYFTVVIIVGNIEDEGIALRPRGRRNRLIGQLGPVINAEPVEVIITRGYTNVSRVIAGSVGIYSDAASVARLEIILIVARPAPGGQLVNRGRVVIQAAIGVIIISGIDLAHRMASPVTQRITFLVNLADKNLSEVGLQIV